MEIGIYTRPDGGVSIVHPVGDDLETAMKKIGVTDWVRGSSKDLPGRTFRDAWRHDGNAISIDMPTAREIHKQRLREMREPLLDSLDRAFTRAQGRLALGGNREEEAKATLAAVEANRQALRDVTADPAIEKAATPEELAAVIPEVLKA